jgi:hypothetical protein
VKRLTMEDYPSAPSWMSDLFSSLNDALTALADGFNRRLTRGENLAMGGKVGGTFKTANPATSTAAVRIKHDLATQPKHVVVTQLLEAGGLPTAVWSAGWRLNANGEIELSFQGLAASTLYTYSVTWE